MQLSSTRVPLLPVDGANRYVRASKSINLGRTDPAAPASMVVPMGLGIG
jgi:hypothetical protein